MDRKNYMKNIYSRYWIYAREKEYGFLDYDKNLCNFISNNISIGQKILDVAIGTGFPFGNYFQNKGYNVYGVDIAPLLIEKCKNLNPSINCKVGDAENLEYPDNFFSCTYCFHSTSYFTNIEKVINEMIRVTAQNGIIIFDIQNKNNNEIIKNYNKMLSEKTKISGKLFRYLKNLVKIILRIGVPDWTNIVHETPIYPDKIYRHLDNLKIKNYKIMVKLEAGDSLETKEKKDSFKECTKIVFVLSK